MTFPSLDASQYSHSVVFYNTEFEDILSKVIICYNVMLNDKVSLNNAENSIRDNMLYNYLKKDQFKKQYKITNYLFDPELPEDKGRIDIRIMPINPFINDDAYYIIECKRLNATNTTGTTGLNSEYIKEGINRFVSKKYSTYHTTNGMIGFVVEPMDIHKNITSINVLLKSDLEANTTRDLFIKEIAPGFNFSYCSTHTVGANEVTIYHLMFDFSKNISP